MAESVKVWVKTSVLDEIIHGKSLTTTKRAIPDASNPDSGSNNQNWGWARASVVANENSGKSSAKEDNGILGDGNSSVKLFIQDEDSSHNRNTIEIPGKVIQAGGVVMANIYDGDSDDEDDYYDDGYGERKPGECKYPDDLITLTHLHEPAVIYALRKRYMLDKIYTATGPILLALNPFKNCGSLYSDKTMVKYRNRGERSMELLGGGGGEEKKSETGDDVDNEFLPPHVFAIADQSFRVMMSRLENKSKGPGPRRGKSDSASNIDQSILVSGESGAGKTVTTKFIMKYLAKLSQVGSNSTRNLNGGMIEDSKGGIEKQVLQSNPILESFGNARTIRNDNSSRFGKYIEIQFSKSGSLTGASIKTYLLEKVRLVHQMPGERNYHIFYEILQGFTDEEFDKYFIGDLMAEDFRMISMSGTFDRRDGVEDFDTFKDLRDAMDVMKFSEAEQNSIMAATCFCLHALNLDFIEVTEDESKIDEENEHLEAVLSLLGVTYDQLNKALCYFSIQAGKERHVRSLSKTKAEKGMQGLVKAYYGALFTFLVHRVNSSITVKEEGGRSGRARAGSSKAASIGVLDIFGFESFKVNSFEQLCINYCNETLQQQFNLFVLKNEQEEYEREGIKWSFISFPENQEVLDLIGKGSGKGIFSILDGQCRAPGTTDKTFANAIYQTLTNHTRFEANFRQVGALKFGVIHYAGAVEYDTAGFVEKNKDEIPREATELLNSSSEEMTKIIGGIIQDPYAPVGSIGVPSKIDSSTPKPRKPRGSRSVNSSRQTVGGQFNTQLQELRAKIDLTSPHYVRCLKPNDLLVPDHFDPVIIADQLRSAGVVEAVRVSRLGYPQRYTHAMFVHRYKILALKELKKKARLSKKEKPVNVLVNAIAFDIQALEQERNGVEDEQNKASPSPNSVTDLESVGIQVGKTKVFLRRKAFDTIEGFRSQKMVEGAVKIQAAARKYVGLRDYQSTLKAIIKIQSQARSMIATNTVEVMRRKHAAIIIQTKWRRTMHHSRYTHIKVFAYWIQRYQRGRKGRSRYTSLNRIRKSIIIQKYWRSYQQAKSYQLKKKSALIIQCATRSHFARGVLSELKAQAKNLAAMSGERDALRQENSSLRQKLEIMEIKVKAAMEKVTKAEDSAEEMKELKVKKEQLEQDKQKLIVDLNESSKKFEDENRRANDAEESTRCKSEECHRLQKESSELRIAIEKAEKCSQSAMSTAKEQAEMLREEIKTLQDDLKESKAICARQLEDAKLKEADLDKEVENLKDELGELRDELKKTEESEKQATDRAIEVANEAALEKESAIESLRLALNERHSKEIFEFNAKVEKLDLELKEANQTILDQAEQIPTEEMVNSEELEAALKQVNELEEKLKESQIQLQNESKTAQEKAAEFLVREKDALEKVEIAERAEQEALSKASEANWAKLEAFEKASTAKEAEQKSLRQAAIANEAREQMQNQLALAEKAKEEVLKQLAEEQEGKDNALNEAGTLKDSYQNIQQQLSAAEEAKEELEQRILVEEEAKKMAMEKSTHMEQEKDELEKKLITTEHEKEEMQIKLTAMEESTDELLSKNASTAEELQQEAAKKILHIEKEKEEALKNLIIAEEEKEKLQLQLSSANSNREKALEEVANAEKGKDEALKKLATEEKAKEEALKKAAVSQEESDEALEKVASVEKEKEEVLQQLSQAIKEKQNAMERAAAAEVNDDYDDGFNEQDEALLAVNTMLRKELEEMTEELSNTKRLLQEERETSKRDLDAFSDALKGVDELRESAEAMSRELQRVKRKSRQSKARGNFQPSGPPRDDATVVTVATATLDSAAKVLNRHKHQQQENPIWNKLKGFKNSFLTTVEEDY